LELEFPTLGSELESRLLTALESEISLESTESKSLETDSRLFSLSISELMKSLLNSSEKTFSSMVSALIEGIVIKIINNNVNDIHFSLSFIYTPPYKSIIKYY
jgi:hypothetical protein